MADIFNIAGEINSTSQEGTAVHANQVKDDLQNKKQSQINEEVGEELELHTNRLNALTGQNYTTVQATQSTTAADIPTLINGTGEGEQTDTLYRVGFWDGSAYVADKYTEYAWNGTAYVILDVKSSIGEVFDISQYNAVGGTPTTYADLTAALSGTNVPTSVHRGGMSIKFIQSIDNKYVRYNLLADSFTNDTTQWAIDDVGVYESNPEFIGVWVDSEKKVLMGINPDGNIFFGKGCPRQVRLYVQQQIEDLSLDEYPDIVAFLGSLVEGDTLSTLLNRKVDKVENKSLIDGDFAANVPPIISTKNSTEYFETSTDTDSKLLEAITQDGKKIINIPILLPSAIFDHTTANEFLEVDTDYYNRVLESVSKSGIKKINKLQVWDIDNINKTDILNLYPSEIYAPIFRNYKFWTDSQNGPDDTPDTNPLTLLWFSDNHGSVNNLRRIVKFNNQYKQYFDDVLFNGDGVTMSVGDDISHWAKEGAGSFLFCIGNHDITNNQVGGTTYIGQKQTYERYLEPFLSQTGITCPVNHTYWYKDYPSAISNENSGGIRLISVDMYHWKETISGSYSDGTSVDTGQQKAWLEDLLADALANHLAVLITRHDPIIEATDVNCSFNSLHRVQNNINDDAELALAIHNFIEDGGEFIAYLCGDTHQDWFTRREDYPEQLQIVVANSGCMTLWRDLELIPATKYMDRFDIISIEPIQKFIRLFRIGVDYDRHGRHIGSMVYDYKNKQLISNY